MSRHVPVVDETALWHMGSMGPVNICTRTDDHPVSECHPARCGCNDQMLLACAQQDRAPGEPLPYGCWGRPEMAE
jgi:hypothetical protein